MPNSVKQFYIRLRQARVCVSVIFIALLTMAILDAGMGVTHFGKLLMDVQIVPAILVGAVVWVLLWVVVTLVFGRFYCSTVCPMGTVQDCAAHLGRRVMKGSGSRYRFQYIAPAMRYAIPLAVAVCLFVGCVAAVEFTDPYYTYARVVNAVARPMAIGLGSLLLSVAVILAVCVVAWIKGRLLCNTLCPVGGLLSLLSRQPVYRIDINTDLCIHCGKCEDVCKASCIDLKDCTVDNSRCVRCMDCTAVCPNSAITLRRGRHMLSTPMMEKL